MPDKHSNQLLFIVGLVIVVLLAIGGALVINQANESRAEIPKLWEMPQFQLTERNGQPFGSEDMKGELNVVNFFFTSCKSICPVMNARMNELYQYYADYDFVRFVSISVDPDVDSLAALRAYAESWGVDDDRWVFLRGPIDQVAELIEKGFKLPANDLPGGHSSRFVLVDQNGMIRGYYDSFDDAQLRHLKDDIHEVAKGL